MKANANCKARRVGPATVAAILLSLATITLSNAGDPGLPMEAGKSPIGKAPIGKTPIGKGVVADPPGRTAKWRVSLGALYRNFNGVSYRTTGYADRAPIPRLLGSSRSVNLGSVGPSGTFADRSYNDGYVRISPPTPGTGETWFWGFQSASQISGDSIAMTRSSSGARVRQSRSSSSPVAREDSDIDGIAPYILLDYMIPVGEDLEVGPQLGFSFIQIDSANTTSTFAAVQSRTALGGSIRDTYALRGIFPPAAPFAGGLAGPGPLIRNLPTSRASSFGSGSTSRATLHNTVNEAVDIDLSTLSLGVQTNMNKGRASFGAGAGVAVNFVDVDATRRETLFGTSGGRTRALRSWTDRQSESEVLFGLYLQLNAGLKLTDRLSLNGIARYDWTESMEGKVGPSTYTIDLDSFSLGLGLGFEF